MEHRCGVREPGGFDDDAVEGLDLTPPAPRPKAAATRTTQQPRRKDGTFAEAPARPRLSPSEIFERSLGGQSIGQAFDE